MTIIRGTTPTLTFELDNDLETAKTVYITFLTGDKEIDITDAEINENVATISLTQAQTLMLRPGICRVKLNWVYDSGDRSTTDYDIIRVLDNRPNKELE